MIRKLVFAILALCLYSTQAAAQGIDPVARALAVKALSSGTGCTVSGSSGQLVYNNGSTGCSSAAGVTTDGTSLSLGTSSVLKWSTDTGLSRDSAGVIDVGNGTAGDKSGTVQAGTIKSYNEYDIYQNGSTTNRGMVFTNYSSFNELELASNWKICWGSSTAAIGSDCDTFLTRQAAATLHLGAPDAATPVSQTLGVQGVVAGTSNTAGANFTIAGSQGTGTGAGGSIIFQTAPAGSSGTSQNGLATALTIDSSGALTISNQGIKTPAGTNLVLAPQGGGGVGIYAGVSIYSNAGINLQGDTQLSRVSAGVFGMPNIISDAGKTDSTLCQDTTAHGIYYGSGTLGVCLGTSSARYKRNINALGPGLAEIMRLRPVEYFYLPGHGDNGARLQYGFTAEDVYPILPAETHLDSEGKPNSVDILGMVPVLVRAVQQQEAEIDKLKAAPMIRLGEPCKGECPMVGQVGFFSPAVLNTAANDNADLRAMIVEDHLAIQRLTHRVQVLERKLAHRRHK